MRDGLRVMAATPALRSVTAAGAINLSGIGLLTIAFPFFATHELGVDRSVSGYMWAAFAAGSMLGALGLVRLQTRFRPENVMLGALAVLGCLMLLWPLAASLPVALGLIALGGFADGPGLAATFGARQRWTPRELLGQIFTTAASLKVGAFAIGAACAGPAVNSFGARGTLLLAAGMQFTAVAAGLLLRRASKSSPDPSAGLPADATSDLQQDDRVHAERDGERDRPAVQVALDERAAPKGPAPAPPMPNAPESPLSLPECRSTRKIRTKQITT